jgi:hypothetical protein
MLESKFASSSIHIVNHQIVSRLIRHDHEFSAWVNVEIPWRSNRFSLLINHFKFTVCIDFKCADGVMAPIGNVYELTIGMQMNGRTGIARAGVVGWYGGIRFNGSNDAVFVNRA